MLYDEVRAELNELREGKKEEARILERIRDVKTHRFDNLDHVVDLSAEYTTKSPGARDDAVIKAITEADRKLEILNKELDQLHHRNEEITEKLWKVKGDIGRAMYLYYVESKPVRIVSEEMHYSETYAWRLIKKGVNELCRIQEEALTA